MFHLPIASLFIVQGDLRPATISSRRSSASRCLAPGVVDALLQTIPEVRIFPCGVSAILDVRGTTLILIDMDEVGSACLRCRPNTCPRGSSLLAQLSASRKYDIVPIVMASHWSEAAIQSSLDQGAVDYVTKPLSPAIARFLWTNLFRQRLASDPTLATRLPSFRLAPSQLFKPKLRWDSKVEAAVVRHFSVPISQDFSSRQFSVLPARAKHLARSVRRRRFNPYRFREDELLFCCQAIFTDICSSLGVSIDLARLQRFILVIQASYLNNHYHNFQHAVDVLQSTYLYLLALDLGAGLTPQHIIALCIAALGHDLGHPGVNNAFLVKKGAPLASLYGNVAVLENFHTMTLVGLIHQHDCLFVEEIFPDLPQFHQLLAHIIISTDMSAHFSHVKRIKELCSNLSDSSRGLAESDSLVILTTLIKCSDISNVVRPFEIAKTWSQCLNDEMLRQCDMELALGIEPSVPRDQLIGHQSHSQVSFIRGLAMPLFESAVALLPELTVFLRQLRANLAIWQQHGRIPSSLTLLPSGPSSAPPRLESPNSPLEPPSSLSPQQSRLALVAGT
ncbi:3',5'-cyclic-nucleotide phosphodiesterase [Entomophthora muscae]|uniref:3',5'-cyclic-nucleotide phosphodiesterase n=2 Tax=Entomophthora muscae TaxID=34485 RepID=A0ACC2TQP7_9FUNG|nr:3',5'-cyclic-nucleotide phosphodiesterase [Entomophthora muscae]KAJ9076830.1 3',5'-cyclic-nucleotide phosphodiesterase [Entomophthora muscae]